MKRKQSKHLEAIENFLPIFKKKDLFTFIRTIINNIPIENHQIINSRVKVSNDNKEYRSVIIIKKNKIFFKFKLKRFIRDCSIGIFNFVYEVGKKNPIALEYKKNHSNYSKSYKSIFDININLQLLTSELQDLLKGTNLLLKVKLETDILSKKQKKEEKNEDNS